MDKVEMTLPLARDPFAGDHLIKKPMPSRPINARQPQNMPTARPGLPTEEKTFGLDEHGGGASIARKLCRLIHHRPPARCIDRHAAGIDHMPDRSQGRPAQQGCHASKIGVPIGLHASASTAHAVEYKIRALAQLRMPFVRGQIRAHHHHATVAQQGGRLQVACERSQTGAAARQVFEHRSTHIAGAEHKHMPACKFGLSLLSHDTHTFPMPSVLAILADGFEEIETMAPLDLLRRASVSVVTASLGHDIHVKGRSNVIIHADSCLDEVLDRDFDCLLLPGGPGVKLMRSDARIAALAAHYAQQERWVAAICAAPAVLHDAGLLRNRRYTAHPSVAGELTEILSAERVVIDGRIITSRGAGTSLDFGLALVRLLVSPGKAEEIASAICL